MNPTAYPYGADATSPARSGPGLGAIVETSGNTVSRLAGIYLTACAINDAIFGPRPPQGATTAPDQKIGGNLLDAHRAILRLLDQIEVEQARTLQGA